MTDHPAPKVYMAAAQCRIIDLSTKTAIPCASQLANFPSDNEHSGLGSTGDQPGVRVFIVLLARRSDAPTPECHGHVMHRPLPETPVWPEHRLGQTAVNCSDVMMLIFRGAVMHSWPKPPSSYNHKVDLRSLHRQKSVLNTQPEATGLRFSLSFFFVANNSLSKTL